MAKHARLSASGSKRWINCPGSVKASEDLPPGKSSFFAMQGTAGHTLAEHCLATTDTYGLNAEDFHGYSIFVHPSDDTREEILVNEPPDRVRSKYVEEQGYEEFIVDDDQQQVEPWAVQMFVDLVREKYHELGGEPLGGPLKLETYLEMGWLHPLLGGTADAHFLGGDGWVYLFDYKHGAGVIVEVEDNTQLIIYSLGILRLYPGAKGVKTYICQPRAPHQDGPVRKVEYTASELEGWAALILEAAEATQRGNAAFKAGDHCRFCPRIHSCETFREYAQEQAGLDFANAPDVEEIMAKANTDNVEDLARMAAWIPLLDAFAKAVDGAIARTMQQGIKVEGFKFVRSKTNRRFGDPKTGEEVSDLDIIDLMRREGKVDDLEDLYKPREMKTLAQMEKLSPTVKKAIKAITYKPEGRLTVAAQNDARAEIPMEKVRESLQFPDDAEDVFK